MIELEKELTIELRIELRIEPDYRKLITKFMMIISQIPQTL
jgi:hypothetical protein